MFFHPQHSSTLWMSSFFVFRHAKYASFMRQVNGWGFKRVVTGSDHNSYYHELFVRDNPQLLLQMKRIKRNDLDDPKSNKEDDGHDDDDENQGKVCATNVENNALTSSTMPGMQASLPTPSPEDLMKFAGMAGMLPAGLGTSAMVGQPNFMLNNMLPASALLINPNAALMNGMNPMNFVSGMPGVPMAPNFNTNATTQMANTGGMQQLTNQQQFPQLPQQQQQQQFQSLTPTVATTSNINSNAMSSQQPVLLNNNSTLMGAFPGVDGATLAKIQEIVAGGGAETLLQQLQQQHGQQQANNNTSGYVGSAAVATNTMGDPTIIHNNNNNNYASQKDTTDVKNGNENPVEDTGNDDDDDDDGDDDEEDVDDNDDDDDDEDDDDVSV
jgi:HSF-type DNA-binding